MVILHGFVDDALANEVFSEAKRGWDVDAGGGKACGAHPKGDETRPGRRITGLTFTVKQSMTSVP
jgi:hypothetical protein